MSKQKVTFGSALWGSTENRLRRWAGLPPVSQQRHTLTSLAKNGVQRQILNWLGLDQGAKLAAGFPADVFATMDRIVQARGGRLKLADGLDAPCFKLDRKSAVVTKHMWIVYANPTNESCPASNLLKLELDIEDAIARETGEMLNIRVLSKPLRIEIDRPEPESNTLADNWKRFKGYEGDSLNYLIGDYWSGKQIEAGFCSISNANEFSFACVAGSGGGKTQFILQALLHLGYHTSPEDLAMIVIDPKALDFPVDNLPHLASPIITDPEMAKDAILSVCEEMDRRTKSRDRNAANKRILIVIDELADLLATQKGDELEDAMQRLAQKGRAWGFSMWVGSQRATKDSMPQSVLQNLPLRFVGKVGSATEAALVSGSDGCEGHRLPGKGAFLMYGSGQQGLRLQSYFVADANKPDYVDRIGYFVDDIRNKWIGKRAHWQLGGQEQPTSESKVTEQPVVNVAILDELDPQFLDMLRNAYENARDKFNLSRVREVYGVFSEGKRMNVAKEKAVLEAFLSSAGT